MSIGLLKKFRPIRNTPHKAPDMDEVEVIRLESPFFLNIINGKVTVWWDPGGLNGREVDTSDLSGWVCIREIQSPDEDVIGLASNFCGIVPVSQLAKCPFRNRHPVLVDNPSHLLEPSIGGRQGGSSAYLTEVSE